MKKLDETIRYIELRDSEGRLIGYDKLQYCFGASKFEKVIKEIEANKIKIEEEQRILKLQFEEEERNRAFEKEQKALDLAHRKKYSIRNFLIAFQIVATQILMEPSKDDGSFFLLKDKVLDGDWTVEEAVNVDEDSTEAQKDLERIFEIMTSEEVD